MACGFCGIETTNPKYCSKSCSAKANNATPKRKRSGVCGSCGKSMLKHSRRSFCFDCRPKINRQAIDITLAEAIYTKHHRSSAFALIRSRARTAVKDRLQTCEVCGYNKHVEVCHIKSIASFQYDTLVSVINNPDNLRLLCPNCHWEFDNLKGENK